MGHPVVLAKLYWKVYWNFNRAIELNPRATKTWRGCAKTGRVYKICVERPPNQEMLSGGSCKEWDRYETGIEEESKPLHYAFTYWCGPSGVSSPGNMINDLHYIKSCWTTWIVIGSLEPSHLKGAICRLTFMVYFPLLTGLKRIDFGASRVARPLIEFTPTWNCADKC